VNLVQSLLGLAVILVAAGLITIYSLPRVRKTRRAFHPIPAMQRLRRAIGLTVEEGARIHVSIGKASIFSPTNASALVGLSTLERVAQLSSVSDRPPVATSGDGTLSILSQDTLRAAYRIANAQEMYDPERGRLAGATPFSYIAGALTSLRGERVSTHILLGNFGPEAALLNEAAEKQNTFTLAGSDSLAAQAAFYATSQEALIGEEVYAVPAYLQAGAAHQASLRAQDVLRWVVILFLVLSVALAIVQVVIS
jgi:hypothetical protein